MAERRMFTKKITDSDAFLDMPSSTQNLYFHLNMAADDEGFVNSPNQIRRKIGASEDDLKLLLAKSFVIIFQTGVMVIKHWKMHNYIQNDRFKPTDYLEEKSQLFLKPNKSYSLIDKDQSDVCIQNVSVGKNSIGKNSIGKSITTTNNIYKIVEDNFARLLTPIEIEQLDLWLSELGNEIVEYAIKVSVENNVKTFAYLKGIINNWRSTGYKTLEDIQNNELQSKSKKNDKNIKPEWFDKEIESQEDLIKQKKLEEMLNETFRGE